ncbi:hypothetical protein LK533_17670 [Sphingomonas sp. PL-96]|uniref:hypothetical protein n=1 Tax=Sphingomonas sp. PL-96 TaxID=2887201 RepID=UPI001E5E48EF|nr:hypothetical protein [Sphingomonas sp. PL-96]MCC2978483.1 hypothetical protein [Sphingomonas sp. PL-96]
MALLASRRADDGCREPDIGRAPTAETAADLDQLRSALCAVLPDIGAAAKQTSSNRCVPPASIGLLQQTGFMQALQPVRYGGLELRVGDFAPLIVDLAEACPSTAWVAAILAQHAHAIALFSPVVQEEIWSGNPQALVASSVAPVGKAENVPGGVQLSGRFGFSSGCDHAEWFMLGFRRPVRGDATEPQFAIVPRSAVAIHDNWHTAGLRGTGSKMLVVESVFVPEYRTESMFGMNFGLSKGFGTNKGPSFHAALQPQFSLSFSAVAVGIARKMAWVYRDWTLDRVRAYTGANAAGRAPAAMRLAQSTQQIEAARALLEKDWAAMDALCERRRLPGPDDLNRWRANQAFAISMAIQAGNRLFSACGGSAWYESSALPSLWCDLNMVGSHAWADYDTAREIYGRQLLGLDLDPAL